MTGSPPSPRLGLGLADFTGSTDLVLCDVWGVIHNGVSSHASAVDALCRFRRGGGAVILVTNAPAPASQVRSRMDRLGVSRDAYDDIATSGDVTSAMIVEAGLPPCCVIGPAGELAVLKQAALTAGRAVERVAIDHAALAVCIGLDDARSTPDLYDDELRALRERDVPMICANPDIVVQVGDALIHCAGAIAERYEAIGGRVIHAGKPFPPIYERARALARAIGRDAPAERTLAIGDAMATDVKGAADQGIRSIFVSTGIHRAAIHGSGEIGGQDGRSGGGAGDRDDHAFRRFASAYAFGPDAVMRRLSWFGGGSAA